MHWRIKAAAFRALAALPLGGELHYVLQRRCTGSLPRPQSQLDSYWQAALSLLAAWRRHGTGAVPDDVLEIGAGRDLAAPLALVMLGVKRVVASDVARLARIDLVQHAAAYMARRAGREADFATWAELTALGVTYRAPDRLRAPYGDAFTCTCSNAVLEHVPRGELPGLLQGLKAATRPRGLSIHHIDYSDHFARSDRRLSRFNFLTFTDRQWSKYNSVLQHVNRLRHCDYLRLFREAGFTIAEERQVMGEPTAEIRANLAVDFRGYGDSDLFGLEGRIVAVA
jgi:hypothetical protein